MSLQARLSADCAQRQQQSRSGQDYERVPDPGIAAAMRRRSGWS